MREDISEASWWSLKVCLQLSKKNM